MASANTGNFTVTVVRDGDNTGPGDDASWCAAVIGVDDAVVRGGDFAELENGVRARLADLLPGIEPELTWEIDAQDDAGRQVPLSPM